jgi:hypothetical protein
VSDSKKLPVASSRGELAAFLKQAALVPAAGDRGRLIFALDATASRQPLWDRACAIQAEMFRATAELGGLEIQLCFYRGQAEFGFSPWYTDSAALLERMSSVFCLGGLTQLRKVLRHAAAQARQKRVHALVFVGDCVEEDARDLYALAGELALRNLPVFLFHEGEDANAVAVFREIARLTKGACCPFDANSPSQLRDLLTAVAVYASGGRDALTRFARGRSALVAALAGQLPAPDGKKA